MSERNTEQQAPIRAWLSCRVDGELVSAEQSFPATRAEVEESLSRAGIAPGRLPEAVVTIMDTDIPALAKRLPRNPDLDELNHLAAQIAAMPEIDRATFAAVMQAGLHCENMAAIINAAENPDRFDFYPGGFNEREFGGIMAEMHANEHCDALDRLRSSGDPSDRTFAEYVERLEGSVDLQKYGRLARENDGGFLTRSGYLIPNSDSLPQRYTGPKDIPAEHRVTETPAPESRPSLLAALKAAKAQSKAAQTERPDTPERKTPSGPEL